MKNSKLAPAFRAAFPHTIPIMAGFLFLGISYGIYASVNGFSFIYPLMTSLLVFGGSLEFVTVSMLLGSFAPFQAFLMALLIQARHLFYGIAMLNKYKNVGLKKFYLIFGMCDESFSINCSITPPDNVDKGWFMFFVTILNHFYWVLGAFIGGLLGSIININIKGIDFVMTAMFVVIFLEHWIGNKKKQPAIIGLLTSVACLVIFGKDSFLIPTMACIILLLTIFRKPLEREDIQ